MGEGAIGNYNGKPIFELEEVVRATKWITELEMTSLRSIRALIYVSTTLGELNNLNTIMVHENINIFKVVDDIIQMREKNTKFSKVLDELEKLAKDEWFDSRKAAADYYYKILKTRTPDEVSPVKLNMWVLVKFLKSKEVYNQFLQEFKKSILRVSNNLDEIIIDDMLKLSFSKNYLRACMNGDFEINKDILVSKKTIDKLKEVKILGKIYNQNFISLSIEKKLAKSIITTLPSVDTNDLSFSQYIQNFGINMQMKIINKENPIILDNKVNNIPDFV